MVSHATLRERFTADTHFGAEGASPGLARALAHVGWRAVGEPTPEELASELVYLVDACVHDHHDVERLADAVARALRDHGPLLDGGLPPVDAYVPAAEELLRQYVSPAARPGLDVPIVDG